MRKKATNTEKINHFQLEAEQAAFLYVKLKKELNELKKFNLLNNFVDFNASLVMPFICPLFVSQNTINFIIKNGSSMKRKFTIEELIEFNDKLNLLKLLKVNPINFNEFKIMYSKIKPLP